MIASNTDHSSASVLDQVGPNIIHHVSNSDISHPIIHFPKIFGVDFSVTKHVFMLWFVALIVMFTILIPIQRSFMSSSSSNFFSMYFPCIAVHVFELFVEFICRIYITRKSRIVIAYDICFVD